MSMKRCFDCEGWLQCDRATKEIICDDFRKIKRNITKLSKTKDGFLEVKKLYEEENK